MTSPASREVLRVRLVRGIAGFDLVVTGCLAVPPFARGLLALLFGADAPFGAGSPRLASAPLVLLFANLTGVLGVLWAIARLRRPSTELALLDVAGRLAVAALIMHAASPDGLSPLLHVVVGTEIAGALAQYWAVRRSHQASPEDRA